jgi:hypothetical protein
MSKTGTSRPVLSDSTVTLRRSAFRALDRTLLVNRSDQTVEKPPRRSSTCAVRAVEYIAPGTTDAHTAASSPPTMMRVRRPGRRPISWIRARVCGGDAGPPSPRKPLASAPRPHPGGGDSNSPSKVGVPVFRRRGRISCLPSSPRNSRVASEKRLEAHMQSAQSGVIESGIFSLWATRDSQTGRASAPSASMDMR